MVLGRLPQKYSGKLVVVRAFQQGDRMRLKGGGTQKLSDLVTNEKWNPYEKSRMMVAEVDGAVSLTPEEIMFLQEENRELKNWGNVSPLKQTHAPVAATL